MKKLTSVLLAAAVLCSSAIAASADITTNIDTTAFGTLKCNTGDKVTIELGVKNIPHLQGNQICLNYDTNLLSFKEATTKQGNINVVEKGGSIVMNTLHDAEKGIDSNDAILYTIEFTAKKALVNEKNFVSVGVIEAYESSDPHSSELNDVDLLGSMYANVTAYDNYLLGDVNADGKVSSDDALSALRAGTGLVSFNDYQTFIADINGDGKINSADALSILRYSVGLNGGAAGTETEYGLYKWTGSVK